MTEPPDAIAPGTNPSPGDAANPADMPSRARPHLPRPGRALAAILAALAFGFAAFAVVSLFVPLTIGPLEFGLVFEEQLFLAILLLCAPVAIVTRARALTLATLVAALVFGGLFGPQLVSLPDGGGSRSDLTVVTWNLEFGSRTPAEAVSELRTVTADVVALEEIEPDVAAAVEADPTLNARYPYRLMAARPYAWGIGLLSRYPLSDTESVYPPACLQALVASPRGPVRVIAGHPRHADLRTVLHVPVGYDSTVRDDRIEIIRQRIDASLAAGERLVVVGDYNTTPTEPEYRILAAGLRDTQVEVGAGPGWTWRPNRLAFLGVGLLRIDLQLSAGAIRPVSTSVDCATAGDHCRLSAAYEIDDPGS